MSIAKTLKEGTKNDAGKLRLDLIPPEFEKGLAEVLTYGAKKYEPKNWEKGIKYSRVYASLRRHLLSWLMGEDIDPESGLPNLFLATFNLMALSTYEVRGMDKDWDDLRKKETV